MCYGGVKVKREIDLNEVNSVYDSIKELYLLYCEELDAKKKNLELYSDQRNELEAYIVYLENIHHSDASVFSPRHAVNKTSISGSEDKAENSKGIDFTAKQKKLDELDLIKKNEELLKNDIEHLQKKISLLERNNVLLKDLSQYYKDTINEPEVKSGDSFDMFFKIYESDYMNLSKHIHDECIQTLSYLLHLSELCQKYVDNDPLRAKLEINNINKNIREVINQLREFIDEFLPYVSSNNNYSLALNQIILKIKNYTPDLNIEVKFDEFDKDENKLRCFLILKVIMEYCLNISKHSFATKMSIEVSNKSNVYEVMINDNGIGFDYETMLKKNNHSGLKIAKDYIEFLKGNLDYKSGKSEGTCISFTVPKGD